MDALPHTGLVPDGYERGYDDTEDHERDHNDHDYGDLPPRKRIRFFTPWTAALIAIITCAVGFYAGARVQQNQTSSSASPSLAGAPSGFAGLASATSTTASSSSSSRRSTSSFPAGLFGNRSGGLPGLGGGTIGTVASVDGKTIYVTETSGNTVKVTLSDATKITKSLPVGKESIHPGDSVTIEGASGSGGTVSATSLSDSGNRSVSTTSSSANSSSNSGQSAVGSLFDGG